VHPGKFLAERLVRGGHTVYAVDYLDDFSTAAADLGVKFSQDPADFNDKNIDVIVFAVAIVALSKVLAAFPTDLLENKLVVDVLSVKTFPKQELLKMLPGGTDLLCTHPMFGPESGKHSWDALPLVFETVQLSETADSRWRCATFLGFFEEAGCTMVEMTCEKHDEWAASSQFLTHTMGRLLNELEIKSTPINTRGFEALLAVEQNTCKDSMDLYAGLYEFNPEAPAQLDRIEAAVVSLRRLLQERTRQRTLAP